MSKIVSVKFHKSNEAVTDHPPAPLVPLPSVPSVETEEDAVQPRGETMEVVMAK